MEKFFKRNRQIILSFAFMFVATFFLLGIGVTSVPVITFVTSITAAYAIGQWQQDKSWRNWYDNVLTPLLKDHNDKEHPNGK